MDISRPRCPGVCGRRDRIILRRPGPKDGGPILAARDPSMFFSLTGSTGGGFSLHPGVQGGGTTAGNQYISCPSPRPHAQFYARSMQKSGHAVHLRSIFRGTDAFLSTSSPYRNPPRRRPSNFANSHSLRKKHSAPEGGLVHREFRTVA